MVAVKDREVSALDVNRAIDTARAVNIPTDQQILHVLRQEFIIDGQEDVREPIGMSGVRLEVKVHIVTGAVSAAQNIVKRAPLRPGERPSCSRSPRRARCSRTRRTSACACSTSAAAPPTSRCSPTARSGIPR